MRNVPPRALLADLILRHRDPKPLPPPMKLTTEMVTALGGDDGEPYERFKTYCCEVRLDSIVVVILYHLLPVQAFNILRKHTSLIINMHILMKDAHIPDFVETGDSGIRTVQQRFRMDMTDEEV